MGETSILPLAKQTRKWKNREKGGDSWAKEIRSGMANENLRLVLPSALMDRGVEGEKLLVSPTEGQVEVLEKLFLFKIELLGQTL